MESSNSKQRPMKQYLEWLEKQIDFCLEDKTMQREHWAFCKAYEKFKSLETTAESEELTPHIEYYSNGNVKVKGQKNSKGQREGIWEVFYENGNIQIRIPFKDGKVDGIEEIFDEQGNINETRVWKNGEVIEATEH
jgi:antitoxin component YwqK of YwqJK toxin-antitoxin module